MDIIKKIKVILTKEEIESPDDIKMIFQVREEGEEGDDEGVDYTVTYPKTADHE